MTYLSTPARSFGGGLNLRDKVDAVSETEAIDCLNVDYGTQGAVAQRAGWANFTGTAPASTVTSLEPYYRTSTSSHQLIAGAGDKLYAYNTSGSSVASVTSGLTSSTVWDFARFGDPGNEYIYAGNGTNDTYRYNGSTWTSGAAIASYRANKDTAFTTTVAMPKASTMCVTPTDNRLVAAGFTNGTNGPNGSTVYSSYVFFSDALQPEKWTGTSFIQVTPGDGERVQAVVAWQGFVFIFKETKFFVYYGTSTDSEGVPIFNYRPVEAGVGLAAPRAYAVTPEGVYFMSSDGVYLTTGAEPELVSQKIEPVWTGDASDFYSGGVLNHTAISKSAMAYNDSRLYLSIPTGASSTNNRTFVLNTESGSWTLFDFPAASLASFKISDHAELVFGRASTSNHLARHNSTYTNDAGTKITSRWRSGWFAFSGDVSRIRESKIWGSGKFFFGLSTDFEQSEGTLDLIDVDDDSVDEWNTPSPSPGFPNRWGTLQWAKPRPLNPFVRRRALRGSVFSIFFGNDVLDQSWAVHRLQNHLANTRRPSVRQPEGPTQTNQ